MYNIPKKAVAPAPNLQQKIAKIETANIHAHQADGQAANRENFDLIDVHIQNKNGSKSGDVDADASPIFPIVDKLID